MLIKCDVEVSYRQMQVQNSKVFAKASRGAVGLHRKNLDSICKGQDKTFHIVIYTNKYKNGFRYRVSISYNKAISIL